MQCGHSVATDGAGNVLLTGDFEGTVDFGGGPLTSAGALDIYLAKYDPSGNHLWSQSFGDSTYQHGESIATDGCGNVFITGGFWGTVDFGGGPLTSAGAHDIYLAKFDPSGNHLWSQSFGDLDFLPLSQSANSVAVDGSGNVLIAGPLQGTVDFGGGPLTGAGGDVFLAKFDPSGKHLWSHSFGDSNTQVSNSVAVDGCGNVLLTGYFWGTVDFGGGPLTSAGGDVFLAKFDPSGNHLWSKGFGDSDNQNGESVATDGSGNVLLTGYFWGTVDFGGGPLTSAGGRDILLAKFDASGNHLWSKGFGDSAWQCSRSVAADGSENVLLTGYFEGTVDFGGGPLTSAGDSDIFLAKFDPSGNHLWSKHFGGSHEDHGKSVVVDGAGNVIFTGEFWGYVDLGGGPLWGAGSWDIFLAKFRSDDPTGITFVGSEDPLLLSSYPNPVLDQTTIRFYVPEPGDVVLRIYDPIGRLVRTLVQAPRPAGTHTVLWDGTNQAGVPVAAGVCFCQLKVEGEIQTRRMILMR